MFEKPFVLTQIGEFFSKPLLAFVLSILFFFGELLFTFESVAGFYYFPGDLNLTSSFFEPVLERENVNEVSLYELEPLTQSDWAVLFGSSSSVWADTENFGEDGFFENWLRTQSIPPTIRGLRGKGMTSIVIRPSSPRLSRPDILLITLVYPTDRSFSSDAMRL